METEMETYGLSQYALHLQHFSVNNFLQIIGGPTCLSMGAVVHKFQGCGAAEEHHARFRFKKMNGSLGTGSCSRRTSHFWSWSPEGTEQSKDFGLVSRGSCVPVLTNYSGAATLTVEDAWKGCTQICVVSCQKKLLCFGWLYATHALYILCFPS
jgi:hypothetical protein